MDEILAEVRTYDGLLELAPLPGSAHPEISWGDYFFYFAPDGLVPRNRQPFATIVTKDYPDDTESHLDDVDRWRLNIHVGPAVFMEVLGYRPEQCAGDDVDYTTTDAFLPHPLYGAYGWVCIVNPGSATITRTLDLLRVAHQDDRRRVELRLGRTDMSRIE